MQISQSHSTRNANGNTFAGPGTSGSVKPEHHGAQAATHRADYDDGLVHGHAWACSTSERGAA